MYDANTVSYTIEHNMYAYNVDKPSIHTSSIMAYIPTLMPEIAMGVPKTNKTSINKGIFINSAKCKVSPASIVSTQNYVTITKWANESLYFPSKEIGDTGICNRYCKFLIDVLNGDIRNMHLTGRI